MLNDISKLGKVLNKEQLKKVNGGAVFFCWGHPDGTPCVTGNYPNLYGCCFNGECY